MRTWCIRLLLVGLVVGCGDQPTELVPERTQPLHGGPAFAVASSDDGLSISTDEDDYAPGDTVWFTGAGWPANDVLDILLEDEPMTHEPHRWTVSTGEDGTFRDSTYVVDVGDLGVTFTLTATSQSTGRWLKVVFTDGNLQAVTLAPPTTATVVQGNSAQYMATVKMVGNTNPCTITLSVTTALPVGANATFSLPNPFTTENDDFSRTLTITTTPATPPGAYPFTVQAGRGGDCQGNGNETTTGTLIVQAAAVTTTTQVTSSQNPSATGDEVTFTATVTSGSPATAVTAGQISFKEGGTSCTDATQLQAAQNVNSSGQVTLTTSSLTIGSHQIRGCYGGATGFLASDGSVTQQVANTATGIELTSSVNPSRTGQSVTFTATATNGSTPVTTGQVSFKTGGTSCSDADATQVRPGQGLSAGGQVAYTTTLAASQSPITVHACYGGSPTPAPGLGASEASLVQTVNKALTTTAVVSSANPSVFSESVTFTATVTVQSPGVGTPAGSVAFKDGTCAGGSDLGTRTLNGSGQASLPVSTLVAASHTISACYAGNADFEESTGTVTQQVNQALTTTHITSTANPSVFSQAVTFDVTVARVAPATATPTGTVELRDGTCAAGTSLASATLTSGIASFTTSELAVGTHTITACYLGTANFQGSEDDVTQQVNRASTAIAVTSTMNPSVFSQSVTFTVTVSPVSPAVATPAGSVTLKDGTCAAGTSLGAATLDVGGEASFTTSSLMVGLHDVTACYAGNASFEGSDGLITQTVNKATTTTAVVSSVNSSILAQPVTFTVTVSPVTPAVATPAGNVTLKDGSCSEGSALAAAAALDGLGQASFTVSSLTAGNHPVTACYAGTASFEASDGSLTHQVTFSFIGFAPPVDRPNMYNLSKAGQAIPLKWELRDFYGNPVSTLANVTVKVTDQGCSSTPNTDQIEEYASGQSGLQNLGGGHYQFNWKTPGSYATSCKTIGLDLGEGSLRADLALFTFKK
jgi:large repetitive protein